MPTSTQVDPPARLAKDLSRFRELLRNSTPGTHFYVVLLGLQTFEWASLMRVLSLGFPYETLEHLHRNSGLPHEALLAWLQMSPRTLVRRKKQRRFSADESDRLLRASRILGRALELFEGDRDAAMGWLLNAQPALGGVAPIVAARTELGAREVESLVGRLEHGVYS
jgi:putative toxin-antitoxin system antitoxin component (TIGR02293 family)